MEEESKELIKRDLFLIKKLHEKTDYTKTNNLKDIYNYVISKELLKTNLGQKYRNRLFSLQEGLIEDKACIICGKLCEDNPLVCNQCNHKLLSTKQEQRMENQDKVSKKEQVEEAESISEKAMELNTRNVISSGLSSTSADKVNEMSEVETMKKRFKKKSIWKLASMVIFVFLIFFYVVGRMNDFKDTNSVNYSSKEPKNTQELSREQTDSNTENIMPTTQQNNVDANLVKDNIPDETFEGDNYFDFTEEELMGQIQEALVPYQLDIGTKKGYSNIYFVLEGDTASNVVYQIVLNEASKVQTISINVFAPIYSLEVFSKAVAATILNCDPAITYDEMMSVIDMAGSPDLITINGISYVGGPVSEDQLSFFITKADIPDDMKTNISGVDKNITDSRNENSYEDIYSDSESYDLSKLLGVSADVIYAELGYPIYTEDHTEYYSDRLSIVYEDDVATKIILGLEERFDFTKIQIPEMNYSIDGIHLGDAKETVLGNGRDTRLFILDGVFYGSTYQIELDGYYVNVDFYTLEDSVECPVYRIELTRLIPVD